MTFTGSIRRLAVTLSLAQIFILSVGSTTLLAQSYLPPAGSPLARKVHPRLYLTADDLPALRQKVLTLYRAEFQAYVNALDAAFDETPDSKYKEDKSNSIFMDAQNYAFLYLIDPASMTGIAFGHTREQYGRNAIAHAMFAKDMDRGDTHSSAKLQSTDGAHHNLSIAVVYDWTHPLLSLAEKQALADGLIRLYENRKEDANPGVYQKLSNQVTGYIHHGCAAALALWGDDELGTSYTSKAQEMLDYFNAVYLERTLETGDRVFQGPAWSEGASYYFLGITNVSFLTGAASSALGRNLFHETDFLRRNILYIFYNTLPLKLRDNYYMSRHDTNSLQDVIEHHISRIMVISAWMLRQADPDMAGLAKWMLTDGGLGLDVPEYKYYDPRIDDLFFQFFWGCKDVAAKSPQSLKLPLGFKLGLGEIVMKSSFDKETSTHIIFWAPELWYSPHSHKDNASFTIYKHGSLALDAGNGKSGDDMPRGDSFSEAVFHNILGLYDPNDEDREGFNYMDFDFSAESSADHWQDPEFGENGRNRVGKLLGFDATSEYDYANYDYTRAYTEPRCSFARRRIAYLRGAENQEFVLIHDVVKSEQEKRFLLHTAFEPMINDNTIAVTNTFDRAHGRMFVQSVLPANKEILKIGGDGNWFIDANWKVIDSRGPYVDWGAYWTGSYRFEIRSQDNEFLTVMQLGDANTLTSMAPVQRVSASDLSGVLINGQRLVLFGQPENDLPKANYTIAANRVVSHLVAGLTPRSQAKVYKNGSLLADTESSKAGAVHFKDNPNGASAYEIVIGAPLAVESGSQSVPGTFELSQNYPNPFAAFEALQSDGRVQTVIPYQLSQPGRVSLQIFDIRGNLVRTLIDKNQAEGNYRISWNGRNQDDRPVPAGVYFYRLQTERYTATRKLVLLR